MYSLRLATLVVLALAACSTTKQMRDVQRSGFLGDYSQLREGGEDEAQLLYINSEADFSRYWGITIDSVTVWRSSETSGLSDEEAQALTDYFYDALHRELKKDFGITETAGPGIMRLRAALTEAEGANRPMNVITTTIPQLRLLTSAVGLASGTAAFVGKARAEAELRDSMTDARLAAGVDARAGTKTFSGMTSAWSDVEEACDYWARRIAQRLRELRAR